MTCYVRQEPNGTITRLRGDLGPSCADCAWVPSFLCDYPVGNDKTCDRLICEDHANLLGPNLHYCQTHYQEWQKFIGADGVRVALFKPRQA